MENFLYLKLITLGSIFILIKLAEILIPARSHSNALNKRFFMNISYPILTNFIFALLSPLTLMAFAYYCLQNKLGLFNLPYFNYYPNIVLGIIQVIILDMAIYWQHRFFHWIPMLWRFHKVHHADNQMDLTTGLRFHPGELLLSMGYKFLIVRLLGIDPLTFMLFESLLAISSMFEHANMGLHKYLNTFLKVFIVTPQMHYIHHSKDSRQMNKNFGFNFSIWDRLFRSYLDEEVEDIGIKEVSEQTFLGLLKLPFKN